MWFVRHFWKSLLLVATLLGIFAIPSDRQQSGQMLMPYQRVWAMIDQNTALWIVALGLGGWLIWTDVRPFVRGWFRKKFSSRHAEICSELADHLSLMRADVREAEHWSNPDNMDRDRTAQWRQRIIRVDALISQISYDQLTADAVRLFVMTCARSVRHALAHIPDTDLERELDDLSGPLFECLHSGKPINPALVRVPRWRLETVAGIQP